MEASISGIIENIFSGDYTGEPLHLFSTVHIAALLVLAALCALMILASRKIKNMAHARLFRYAAAGFMIFNEICYEVWSALTGSWSIDYTLPLQLCDAALILSAVMLATRSYALYEIMYFWGLGASLQALLTPDIYPFSFPHFIFFNFFTTHGLIVIAVLYMTWVEGCRPRGRSILKTIAATNLYMGAMALVNLVTGGNYLFLRHKPESASIMDLLGPWPWYIAGLEAVGVMLMLLLYLPYYVMDGKDRGAGFTNSQ